MGSELEFKLGIPSEETMELILRDPDINAMGDFSIVSMHAYYYDTKDLDLLNNNFVVRVRQENGEYVATLKRRKAMADKGLFFRDEWNVNVPTKELNIAVFADMREQLFSLIQEKELIPVVETDFIRRKMDISYEGAEIELAVDHGKIRAVNGEVTVREVEIEFKGGQEEGFFDYRRKYFGKYDLSLDEESKFARGIEIYLKKQK